MRQPAVYGQTGLAQMATPNFFSELRVFDLDLQDDDPSMS